MSDQPNSPWSRPQGPAEPGAAPPWEQPAPPPLDGSTYAPQAFGQPSYPAPAYPGPYGDPAYAHPRYAAPSYAMAAPLRSDYARWGKRVGAFLIDQVPTSVGLAIFYVGYGLFLADVSRSGSFSGVPAGALPMIIGSAIMLVGFGWTIYNRWIVAGRTGQSMGKRVTGISLISELTGQPVGALNAFLRDLVHIVDGFAYIGYLWPLWDERRQTFSDKLMKTIVVDAGTAP